jgi:hypothetical protein
MIIAHIHDPLKAVGLCSVGISGCPHADKLIVRGRQLNSGFDRILPSGSWLILSLRHYLWSDHLSRRPGVAIVRPLVSTGGFFWFV